MGFLNCLNGQDAAPCSEILVRCPDALLLISRCPDNRLGLEKVGARSVPDFCKRDVESSPVQQLHMSFRLEELVGICKLFLVVQDKLEVCWANRLLPGKAA